MGLEHRRQHRADGHRFVAGGCAARVGNLLRLVRRTVRLSLLVADLSELPERQRGALVMRELSGLSHEEIAFALGTSVGAAKQTIFEARRSLLEFREGRAMVCEHVRRTISDADGRALRGRRVRAHLRDCSGCAAFAAAIPARGADLRAIAPPLPAVAAAGLFARSLGAGSGHGGASAGGLAAGAAGKTVGVAFAAKAIAGVAIVAIVATATVGVTGVLRHTVHTTRQPPATRTAPTRHAGTAPRGANPGSSTLAPAGDRATRRTACRRPSTTEHPSEHELAFSWSRSRCGERRRRLRRGT